MTITLRFRRALRLLATWGFLLALCLACTVEEGERSSTGLCPEGETCSDGVSGLQFYGPLPADGTTTELLPRVAAEGTLNVGFSPALEGEPIGTTRAESSAPWAMTIEAADPARDTFAVWTGEDDLRLVGVTPGESYLRIVDAESGNLHDRVLVTVERITRVDVELLGGEPLVPGTTATAVFQLFGESQLRLIDESMTIASEDAELERASWDCVDFVVPDQGEVRFVLSAGHRRWEVTVPVQG